MVDLLGETLRVDPQQPKWKSELEEAERQVRVREV